MQWPRPTCCCSTSRAWPQDVQARFDLPEIIDDQVASEATIITSQLPIEHWHAWVGDAIDADAILDRLMQQKRRLTLTGETLRKKPSATELAPEI